MQGWRRKQRCGVQGLQTKGEEHMKDRKLMQMALNALEAQFYTDGRAIKALRDRLAQPEPEPVAWGIANTRPTEKNPLMMVMLDEPKPSHLVVPLYTAPPKRKWKGLTSDDKHFLLANAWNKEQAFDGFMDSIDKFLEEKNT
jgi:hypothetical protein